MSSAGRFFGSLLSASFLLNLRFRLLCPSSIWKPAYFRKFLAVVSPILWKDFRKNSCRVFAFVSFSLELDNRPFPVRTIRPCLLLEHNRLVVLDVSSQANLGNFLLGIGTGADLCLAVGRNLSVQQSHFSAEPKRAPGLAK